MTNYVIQTDNLTKIYKGTGKNKSVTALDDVTLSIEKGSIFGLLGPNGAGKTTLVKVLLEIVFPTRGEAKLLGENLSNYKVKKRIGYLPENHKFPQFLNGGKVLKYFAELSDMNLENIDSRIDELLSLVKMTKWKNTKIKNYSKGMMQRLGIAQALINDPEIIFLDEPTDGVDPIGRKEIRDILIELKKQGKTIFLNSHLLSEIEMVCDSVAILHNGKVIHEGTVDDITTKKEMYTFNFESILDEEIKNHIEQNYSVSNLESKKITLKLEGSDELNRVIDFLRGRGIVINSIVPQKVSLEDIFISLIKEKDSDVNIN